MGNETSIRCPKSLRERLNLLCAQAALKKGRPVSQAEMLEEMIKKEEKEQ